MLETCVTFRDAKRDPETLFRDERVADRASSFASGIGTHGNVLGRVPRTTVSAWPDADDPTFPLRRSEPWDSREPEPPSPPIEREPNSEADGPPDRDAMTNASHASMSMISPIRLQLWDRAGWHGTVYVGGPRYGAPPTMALMFSDRETPIEIFRQWKEEGSRGELRLRISIVRGVDTANPHAYYVIVGAHPDVVRSGTGIITLVNRLHRMDPKSSVNLERFLADYEKHRRFFLAPAYKPKESPPGELPAFASGLSVELKSLKVVQA